MKGEKKYSVLILWPSSASEEGQRKAEHLLEQWKIPVYEKKISMRMTLSEFTEFIYSVYHREPWADKWKNVKNKASWCYAEGYPVVFYKLEGKKLPQIQVIKQELRNTFKMQKNSVHLVEKCREETWEKINKKAAGQYQGVIKEVFHKYPYVCSSLRLKGHELAEEETVDAGVLWNPLRFDLNAKIIYIEALKKEKDITDALALYKRHIEVFCGGRVVEAGNQAKDGMGKYVETLHSLYRLFREGQEIPGDPIPVDEDYAALDGSHCTALAWCFDRRLRIYHIAKKRRFTWDYLFFRKRGMAEADLLKMAHKYYEEHPMYCLVFRGKRREAPLHRKLSGFCSPVYIKRLKKNNSCYVFLDREFDNREKVTEEVQGIFKRNSIVCLKSRQTMDAAFAELLRENEEVGSLQKNAGKVRRKIVYLYFVLLRAIKQRLGMPV